MIFGVTSLLKIEHGAPIHGKLGTLAYVLSMFIALSSHRLVLNYKRISYRTVWVEFADIASTMQAIGAAPTPSAIPGGPPRYTVPAIYDPNTECTVTDSFKIAQYLDRQYPERPVIPAGTEELQAAFADSFLPNYGMVSVLLIAALIQECLLSEIVDLHILNASNIIHFI
jgi:hypothetical protein